MIIKKYLFIICICFIMTSGCSLTYNINNELDNKITNSIDMVEFNDLKDVINKYYYLEKNELWNECYKFRTPSFRELVPKDLYINKMKENNEGWGIVDFQVISIEKVDDYKVKAKIKFIEKTPEKHSILGLKSKQVVQTIEEETKWKKIDGIWYCVDPGTRNHLSLNIEFEKEF